MVNKNIVSFIFISTLIAVLVCFSCLAMTDVPDVSSEAIGGMYNLKDWDFENNGLVSLDGQWEFYWKRLLKPEDFITKEFKEEFEFIKVPSSWHDHKINDKKLPYAGYGTYRLRVKIRNNKNLMALKIGDVSTAYNLWIDSKLLVSNGIVAKSKKDMVPGVSAQSVIFKPEKETFQIIIQVSNFHYDLAGIHRSIRLGYYENIFTETENRRGFDFFIIGCLFIMGIFNLILFLLGKKDMSPLYFGLFCLIIMIRTSFSGERVLLSLITAVSWFSVTRIELASVFISTPVFFMFLHSLFPNEVHKVILRIFQITGALWGLTIIIIPSNLFSLITNAHHIVLLAACVLSVYIVIRAVIKKRSGAFFLLIGLAVFILTIINDILYVTYIIQTNYFVPLGLFFFILSGFALNEKFINAEKYLIKSEEKNRAILNALPDSVFQINEKGIIIDYKISDDNMLNLSQFEISGKNISEFFPSDFADLIKEMLPVIIHEGSSKVKEYNLSQKNRALFYEIRMVKSGEKTILTIIRDITEKKRTEEMVKQQERQLIQADKLASLGTLVAGVAHEINNPNNSIMVSSQINSQVWDDIIPILDDYASEKGDFSVGGYLFSELRHEMGDSFKRILRNSKRIKNIVDDLRKYARDESKAVIENIDVNSLVKSGIELLEGQIKKSTTNFNLLCGKNIPPVKGNYQKLEQVIINIIQNACQALPGKDSGIFVTTTSNEKKGTVIITVKDEGVGMDSDTLKRICDPFFTTKANNEGTGLGLAISSRIVENHGGELQFYSAAGEGTTVKLILRVF